MEYDSSARRTRNCYSYALNRAMHDGFPNISYFFIYPIVEMVIHIPFFFFTHSIKGDIRLRKFIRERYDDFPFARNFVHGPTILIKRTLSESSISFSSVNPSMILDLRLPRGKSILINIRNRSIETVQQLSSARSTPVSIVESHC